MFKRCYLAVFCMFFTLIAFGQNARIAVSNMVRLEGGTIQLCGGGALNLTDSSTNSNNTRTWIFKNGSPLSSSLSTQNVTFNLTGINTVYLISNGTLPDTTYILIQVNPKPIASFTFTNNACAGSNVSFTNTEAL